MFKLKKKIVTLLILTMTLVSSVVSPTISMAQTINNNQAQTTESIKQSESEGNAAITKNSDINIPESKENIEGSPNSNFDIEKNIGESQNANASPTTEDEIISPSKYLLGNRLIQGNDGKLYTTTDSSYFNENIMDALGIKNYARALSNSVYVDPNTNIANIDIYFSNGHREYGWYGKRFKNEVALCIELGVALNVGENGNYTTNPQNTPLFLKMSLVKYYGLDTRSTGNPLYNELMTQLLSYELQGHTPTSINGVFSMADYEAFKNEVMAKVNAFYVTPSIANSNITLKMGESIELTDTTGSFANYKDGPIANTSGVLVEKKGNNVKFTATKESNEKGNVFFGYNIPDEYRGVPLILENPYTQNVLVARVSDPKEIKISITVIKNGDAEFQKVSEFSNLSMADVTYKVKVGNEAEKEMKTNAEGKLIFKDILHETKIQVTEIKNPIGWVLDPTTYELTIEGGTTVTKKLENKLQMGRFKGLKLQRVLDIETTKKEEKPVYKKIPLAGAIFDVVAKTDILLPDGKTVFVKEGTIIDTVTTDENGYFESTKDLLIGENNYYQLVEKNIPEGFRPPSEDQTLFSIPYGANTEKLIIYDLGTIDNDVQTGKLKLFKRDSHSLLGIDGAQFTIEMMSGIYAGTFFKFATSMIGNEFELPKGEWRLTEIKLPDGFIFDEGTPQTQWVTIVDNETIELNWNNKKIAPIIQTKAHTADGSQQFTHGDVLAMYDDVKITHDVIDGTKGAFVTILYAVLPDGTSQEIWRSDKIDYVINDKEFVQTVVTEKVDTGKYPEGTYFSFKEINYDDTGKENGRHNDDLKETSQSIYPKKKPETPLISQKGTLPQTGSKEQLSIILSGVIMIAGLAAFEYKRLRKRTLSEKQ